MRSPTRVAFQLPLVAVLRGGTCGLDEKERQAGVEGARTPRLHPGPCLVIAGEHRAGLGSAAEGQSHQAGSQEEQGRLHHTGQWHCLAGVQSDGEGVVAEDRETRLPVTFVLESSTACRSAHPRSPLAQSKSDAMASKLERAFDELRQQHKVFVGAPAGVSPSDGNFEC